MRFQFSSLMSVLQRRAVGRGEAIVRIHGRGVIAPDDELLDRADGLARLRGQLRKRAIVVEAEHRREVLFRQARRRLHGDIGIGVGGITDDQHLHAAAGDGVERLPLLGEYLRVLQQEVLALHPGAARAGADEHGNVDVLERHLGVRGAAHAGEQGKCAVLELHHDALQGGLRLVDRQLQHLQLHGLVAAEHFAAGNPEEQAVTDLTGSAGDCYADGLFHRRLQDDVVARGGVGRAAGNGATHTQYYVRVRTWCQSTLIEDI